MDVERTIEFILRSQANAEVRMQKIEEAQAKGDVQMEEVRASQRKTEETLRRAIRLAVREAPFERQKRRELDARFDEEWRKLTEVQRVTWEMLQGFIRSMQPRGNGEN